MKTYGLIILISSPPATMKEIMYQLVSINVDLISIQGYITSDKFWIELICKLWERDKNLLSKNIQDIEGVIDLEIQEGFEIENKKQLP